MESDPTTLLGVCGFKVPASTAWLLLMISWANRLASVSVLNLRVRRTRLLAPSGASSGQYETYQISGLVIFVNLPSFLYPSPSSRRQAGCFCYHSNVPSVAGELLLEEVRKAIRKLLDEPTPL